MYAWHYMHHFFLLVYIFHQLINCNNVLFLKLFHVVFVTGCDRSASSEVFCSQATTRRLLSRCCKYLFLAEAQYVIDS